MPGGEGEVGAEGGEGVTVWEGVWGLGVEGAVEVGRLSKCWGRKARYVGCRQGQEVGLA